MCKFTWTSTWTAQQEIKANPEVHSEAFMGQGKSWADIKGIAGGISQSGHTNAPCYPMSVEGGVNADLQIDIAVQVPDHIHSHLHAYGAVRTAASAELDGRGTSATVKSVASMWADETLTAEQSATSSGEPDDPINRAAGGKIGDDPTALTVRGDAFYEGSFELLSQFDPRLETECDSAASSAGECTIFVECHEEVVGKVTFDGEGSFQAAEGRNGWTTANQSVSRDEDDRTEEGSLDFFPPE